jgi:glycosyltransferase involved in cell wall biosynthesis
MADTGRMELRAEDITIAITVFSRRDYVLAAIRSALNQTVPVKVIVVEDCGPDATMRDFILQEFGGRVEYYRNPQNRGLFDNWNACLEYCRTPWLSILHDDDLLQPQFVETMLALAGQTPDCALFFGRSASLEEGGKTVPPPPVTWKNGWRAMEVTRLADECFVLFPGQLFRVAAAQALGGFRKKSYFTGDWDMWFQLALRFGGAQSATEVSVSRSHYGLDRGTNRVLRHGWKWILDNVQRKRNLALLYQERKVVVPFERAKFLRQSPIPSRILFRFAHGFTRRVLRYNWWLFTHGKAPHWRYAVTQCLIRVLGPQALRLGAVLKNKW